MACWRSGLTHQPFTLAFTGSNPVHVIFIRAFSSAGRASALQAECRRFDPVSDHHFPCNLILFGPVVQLVRMPPCHGGGRGFESLPGRQNYASVAQLVEQGTENPCVHSSILCWGTIGKQNTRNLRVFFYIWNYVIKKRSPLCLKIGLSKCITK